MDWSASPSYRRLLTPDEEEEPQLLRSSFGGDLSGISGPSAAHFPAPASPDLGTSHIVPSIPLVASPIYWPGETSGDA